MSPEDDMQEVRIVKGDRAAVFYFSSADKATAAIHTFASDVMGWTIFDVRDRAHGGCDIFVREVAVDVPLSI